MANEIVETKAIEQASDSLYKGVSDIIDNARQEVVVYVNKHSDLMFWHIGHYMIIARPQYRCSALRIPLVALMVYRS
jgi:hypothetical protein